MTQEEIRKLLGGYATNSLTDGERTALFEAALEDRELFNALQNEDALRELLADPATREQVRLALSPTEAHTGFWTPQRWFMGAASLAASAAIVIGIVVWRNSPVRESLNRQSTPQQMAQRRDEPKLEALPSPAERQSNAQKEVGQLKRLPASAAPALAPAAPPPPAPASVAQATTARDEAQQDQLAGAVLGRLAVQQPANEVANATLYTGPLVRYSLLRSKTASDALHVEVVSQVAGTLSLYRADAAGQWQRVFPAAASGIPIAANMPYQIPYAPVAARGDQDKLRLVIEPGPARSFGSQVTTGELNEPRAKALAKKAAEPMPLVVEIAIGPN